MRVAPSRRNFTRGLGGLVLAFALDAALLARALPGRPVRLQWMRDDEFAWEPYGPAMAMQARGALDTAGRIVDWN